jgi:hypothetical protein
MKTGEPKQEDQEVYFLKPALAFVFSSIMYKLECFGLMCLYAEIYPCYFAGQCLRRSMLLAAHIVSGCCLKIVPGNIELAIFYIHVQWWYLAWLELSVYVFTNFMHFYVFLGSVQ